MARVNVEQKALSDQTDPRYRILGRELGIDRWSALGRMCVVWNLCQEHESYVLAREILNSLFDDISCLSDALLTSGLGKKHRFGIYIAGTEGRIEWLANKRRTGRQNGKRGGRPRKTNTEPIKNQDGLRAETPPAPAPAPAENLFVGAGASDGELFSEEEQRPLKFAEDSQAMRLAHFFFESHVLVLDPNHKPPNWQTWARHCDGILRIDKRAPGDVRRVIAWLHQDVFWRANILSPAKLREKFTTLLVRANEGTCEKRREASTTGPRVATHEPEAAALMKRGGA
jgi:hypothetical protein